MRKAEKFTVIQKRWLTSQPLGLWPRKQGKRPRAQCAGKMQCAACGSNQVAGKFCGACGAPVAPLAPPAVGGEWHE